METQSINLKELKASGVDFLTIIVSKAEVLKKDTSAPLRILKQLTEDLELATYFKERVEVLFDGYNDTTAELWEIDHVREYAAALDAKFPYWLYFISKESTSLRAIIKCHLYPFLTPEGEKQYNGPILQNYLLNRWFPAMNQICDATGISDFENGAMTDRFFTYMEGK